VRCEDRVLLIPKNRHLRHFVKANARGHEYWDGSLALFHGPRKIASYTADGKREEEQVEKNPPRKSAPRRHLGMAWTSFACQRRPQKQKNQKRTFDVLPKPDIFKSYRHVQKLSTCGEMKSALST
jgi:hypothetical protein